MRLPLRHGWPPLPSGCTSLAGSRTGPAIERRWSEGRGERAAEIADLNCFPLKVDVIVTYGGAVPIVKQVTASIPVVFAIAVDPLGTGLVTNLSRPGGNVTGMFMQVTEIGGKRS